MKKQPIPTSVAKIVSRDEMNLAEFPLAVLATRTNPNIKTLEFQDTIRGKSGELTNRKWIITGADKFGLPTASDEEVMLGLLKLTVDDELRNRKVLFTRYELMKVLRWQTEGRNYSRLQKALDRLSGVRIKATNAFYDNEAKAHSTRNFGIIDGYELNDGREGSAKQSYFVWSDVLFKSFQSGFIKKLDLDFYLDLKSAVSKRLYRYLDKHFWYKSKVQIDLFLLAHEKLGISRNYRFVSSIRQHLDPAVQELIDAGFLSRCEYVQKGKGADVIFYSSGGRARVSAGKDILPSDRGKESDTGGGSGGGENVRKRVINLMVERGLQQKQAMKLTASREPELLTRMLKIVEYFDELCSRGSHQVIKSPVGFLYKAMENPAGFGLPGDLQRPKTPAQGKLKFAAESASARRESAASEDSIYLIERKRKIQSLRTEVDAPLLDKLKGEVESALSNVKGLISPERFNEVVDHGVDEKLARLFVLPDFEEWKKERKKQKSI